MTNYMTTCSFIYLLIPLKQLKWLRICFKNKLMEKIAFIEKTCCSYTLALPHRGNSNVYLQHMLQEQLCEHLHLPSVISIVFASFKPFNVPFRIKIPVSLLQMVYILHDSYISKFEFMNYLFNNLVVALL